MASYTVLIGYGRRSHQILRALTDRQLKSSVVVDRDLACAAHITRDGSRPVVGDGTDVATLRAANIPLATRVIVAVTSDAAALRIVSAVRALNDQATVVIALRQPRWRELALSLGADHVAVCETFPDLLTCDIPFAPPEGGTADVDAPDVTELVLVEREVTPGEIDRRLSACGPAVLAALRGITHSWRDQDEPLVLRAGDRLLEIQARPM
ncbi:NAD(P)-binding protein [Lentzea sp. NPDC051208]|uniref:NAD(P)-binding protein n=1 Tax=Lentzea sp. NPDC051208 TaxID=3154642 RepID=UPI00342EF49E